MINEVSSSCMYVIEEADCFYLESPQECPGSHIDAPTEATSPTGKDKTLHIERFNITPEEDYTSVRRSEGYSENQTYGDYAELRVFSVDSTYGQHNLTTQVDPSLERSLYYATEQKEIEVCTRPITRLRRRGAYRHVSRGEKIPHLVAKRNARERRRVQAVNSAFAGLRKILPLTQGRSKRVSKVRILQEAINYIDQLRIVLDEHDSVYALDRETDFGTKEIFKKNLPENKEQNISADKVT